MTLVQDKIVSANKGAETCRSVAVWIKWYLDTLVGGLRKIVHGYEQHKVCDSFVWVRGLVPHSGQDNTEPGCLSVDFRRKLLGLGKWKWRTSEESCTNRGASITVHSPSNDVNSRVVKVLKPHFPVLREALRIQI
jgi:hypothetical protein